MAGCCALTNGMEKGRCGKVRVDGGCGMISRRCEDIKNQTPTDDGLTLPLLSETVTLL